MQAEENKKMYFDNPYKLIWLIITDKLRDSEVIEEYNKYLVEYKDSFEYKSLKIKYDLFATLLKERGELNE